jgi:ketosteroid isomerase-like protein
MKIRLVAALVGLAISFALPTFAQQTNTPDPQLRQKLVDVIAKHSDALNKNDAAAAAACFTQDAVFVTDRGPVNGREAIEKWYVDFFKHVLWSDHVLTIDQDSPHVIGTAGNEIWATGGWSLTFKFKGEKFGPKQTKGYWSVIRMGDDWKIRMLTSNSAPAN